MDDFIRSALESLKAAESGLREQVQAAISHGRYETVLILAGWAKRIADLAAEAGDEAVGTTSIAGAVASAVDAPIEPPQKAMALPTPKQPRRTSNTYPRFFRNGHGLLKIGWSKQQKAEYEHRAPANVLDALVATIGRVNTRGRFAMEEVLAKISVDGMGVPTYQTYLCLAWLRQEGLVLQEGRQGYRVKLSSSLVSDARTKLEELPQRDNEELPH